MRAGCATFLTMAYILFVNPQILSQTGMPAQDVVAATALASALACFVMGLWARYPFALAPGMGLNAFFALSVVIGLGVSWRVALAAVFVEGVLFLILALSGARRLLLESIPLSLKRAATGGIGLFLAFVGLQSAGLVERDAVTMVRLGDLRSPQAMLALAALALITVLHARRVPGAILIGLVGSAAVAWLMGWASPPAAWLTAPRLPAETLFAFDFRHLLSAGMLTAITAFLLVDLLDTAGTLVGVGHLGGFLDDRGRLERADEAFAADAVGTTIGAVLGTSTVTTYVESATGIEEGGRTGLTSVTVGCLFLASLVLAPIFVAVPAAATAPALIMVGCMMMRGLDDLPWGRIDEALPAFLTMVAMPLTFSIANGLGLGVVSWVVIRALSGRWRAVPPPLWMLAILLAAFALWMDPR